MPESLLGLIKAVIIKRGVRRFSAINEMLDHISVGGDQRLGALHGELRAILDESHKGWPSYDYGEGYYYQSYGPLKIRGFRNTALRLEMYGLPEVLDKDKRLLDIGCNAGFLALACARYCRHVDAFELNPYLIRIAERCREYEGIENVTFSCCSFDDFRPDPPYDVVLSLANHHTFDGNMRPEFRGYIEKIRGLMPTGGRLLFESHPGEHRQPQLREHLGSIQDLFRTVSELEVNTRRSVYDTNRLVVWLEAV